MSPDPLVWMTIAAMAVVTFGTRAGGAFLMSFVPMTQRLQLFLRHLASSVMVAIVVGAAARGDVAAWLAIVVSMGVMIATRQMFGAIAAGMATAAGWRALVVL